jgi:hypothetical protein
LMGKEEMFQHVTAEPRHRKQKYCVGSIWDQHDTVPHYATIWDLPLTAEDCCPTLSAYSMLSRSSNDELEIIGNDAVVA